MTVRSWADATVDLLLAAVGLSIVVFPALSVGYSLRTGAPIHAGPPGFATAIVAVGGSYPFVAGQWDDRRLWRFVAALVVTMGTVSLLGLAALAQLGGPLPDRTAARAVVLVIAYPTATVLTFRDRIALLRRGPPESAP